MEGGPMAGVKASTSRASAIRRAGLGMLAVAALLAVVGCSPEDGRARGGGLGAAGRQGDSGLVGRCAVKTSWLLASVTFLLAAACAQPPRPAAVRTPATSV